jgi:hypothetical protein
MERKRGITLCEAPSHSEGCNGIATTIDHFTPECIAKLWGWSRDEIDSDENLQYLSKQCHKAKDFTTQARLALAVLQQGGESIGVGDHQKVEDSYGRKEILIKYKEFNKQLEVTNESIFSNVFTFLLALRVQELEPEETQIP